MSFSFYNRWSAKTGLTKDTKDTTCKHASASFATAAFNASHTVNSGHSRITSKMRFPFLGKRRKSLATLRPSANDVASEDSGGRRGHYKSVSQLANETAARLARSSLGAAGSRSTGNLELSASEPSTLQLVDNSAFITPIKNRPLDARHTMLPSGSSKTSTPDNFLSQNKRASEKPEKLSFLSRISSRPSLSLRYSSADLKTATKARGFFKSPEKQPAPLVTPQRKGIIRPVRVSSGQVFGDDKDFFTTPRAAPTPPSLSFATPDSSLLESPLGPSQSTVTLPSQKQSPLFGIANHSRSPGKSSIRRLNAAQTTSKYNSSPTTSGAPASLSLQMAIKSPRRHSVSVHSQTASPGPMKTTLKTSTSTPSPAARPRGSHVRIGKEKVTVSVANMLEAELGVEVGDSEDSSYYDDSYEETRRFGSQVSRLVQKPADERMPVNDSSDLPPLSPSADDIDLSFKFPKARNMIGDEFELNSQSPLTTLMSASTGEKERSMTAVYTGRFQAAGVKEAKQEKTESTTGTRIQDSPDTKCDVNHAQEKAARSVYLHSLGSQARDVDRLDRISEKSVSVRQESPRDRQDKNKESLQASDANNSTQIATQLQRDLDVQCARFDKLAGHLLQIIQRHQNEKVQLENQITTLQNEVHRNEKEIKALRKLISRSNNRSSREGWHPRRLVRVASMQSFLSNMSAKDEEVDMSIAVEMLARSGRRNVLLTPDISRDLRASIDLSPYLTPTTAKRMDLRRSKTMPDLHKAAVVTLIPTPMPSPPLQDTSPDISGLGLRLSFPLPEPLKLPSIASTIMAAAKESNDSVPSLTSAPTAASGISLATESSANTIISTDGSTPSAKSVGVGRGAGRSTREKRMAGEWRPGGTQGLYRPAEQLEHTPTTPSSAPPSAPPSCKIPELPASASYANNLNKALLASPIEQVMKAASPDLDAMYRKIVSNSNGLLG